MGAQRMMPTGFGDDQDSPSASALQMFSQECFRRTLTSITLASLSGRASFSPVSALTRLDCNVTRRQVQRVAAGSEADAAGGGDDGPVKTDEQIKESQLFFVKRGSV